MVVVFWGSYWVTCLICMSAKVKRPEGSPARSRGPKEPSISSLQIFLSQCIAMHWSLFLLPCGVGQYLCCLQKYLQIFLWLSFVWAVLFFCTVTTDIANTCILTIYVLWRVALNYSCSIVILQIFVCSRKDQYLAQIFVHQLFIF